MPAFGKGKVEVKLDDRDRKQGVFNWSYKVTMANFEYHYWGEKRPRQQSARRDRRYHREHGRDLVGQNIERQAYGNTWNKIISRGVVDFRGTYKELNKWQSTVDLPKQQCASASGIKPVRFTVKWNPLIRTVVKYSIPTLFWHLRSGRPLKRIGPGNKIMIDSFSAALSVPFVIRFYSLIFLQFSFTSRQPGEYIYWTNGYAV